MIVASRKLEQKLREHLFNLSFFIREIPFRGATYLLGDCSKRAWQSLIFQF